MIFKLILITIATLCFNINFISMNSLECKVEQFSSVVNDVTPLSLRVNSSVSDLYVDDYYDNYYFVNSFENYGRNVKGSCTQLALAQLLSYIDTYWDDSIIPEDYEKYADLSSDELSYTVDSPGIRREPFSLVSELSTYDYYWNAVNKYYKDYFHLLMIKIGYEQFGYYNFNDSNNPCALTDGQINKIAAYYLYNYLGKSKSNFLL